MSYTKLQFFLQQRLITAQPLSTIQLNFIKDFRNYWIHIKINECASELVSPFCKFPKHHRHRNETNKYIADAKQNSKIISIQKLHTRNELIFT